MPGAVRTDLVGTPENPVPAETRCFILRSGDGLALRFAQWPASAMPIQGTILLLQGRGEFIEKYFETVEHFRGRGFDVVSFDWRGQGGSERLVRNTKKGHVRRFSDYHRDLDAAFAEMEARASPKPWFVVAHSMGAAIFLARLARGPTPALRAALTSPMIGFSPAIAPRYAATISTTLAGFGLGRCFVPGGGPGPIAARPFENNRLSTDRTRYERNAAVLAAAPELAIGDPTIDWAASACHMMSGLSDPKFPRRLTTPLLVVASGDDRVVSTHATERFASRLKSGSAIVIVGARHELLMESDFFRDQALAAIDAFLPGGELSVKEGEAALIA
ncbi:MAG: alpha/beta hydrolase [Hyphomicrobiales bacterium]|nr:alpha/beta hydrolase [Hyphomicrobiales bacterium]MBV9589470.1 alpha/beta hydrolase [Hyphomicrobiales bacterium]MBV9976048.1 alpha/beta hydrolase [Hyphomicrobiales bacterium]